MNDPGFKLDGRDHTPTGNPCECGLPFLQHRVYHNPKCSCGKACYQHGPAKHVVTCDPCSECGLPASRHWVRHLPDAGEACSCGVPLDNHKKRKRSKKEIEEKNARLNSDRAYFIGIDGEGVDDDEVRPDGTRNHRYNLLTWSDGTGQRSRHLQAKKGGHLTTKQCLDFILEIPLHAEAFAFSFGYDLTKILADLDDKTLWRLLHPSCRQRKPRLVSNSAGKSSWIYPPPAPELWEGYELNLVGSRFSVARGDQTRIVWDCFKFFGKAFVEALKDWFSKDDKSQPDGRQWERPEMRKALMRMRGMKEQRGEFRHLPMHKIRDYNRDECKYLARLAEKLVRSHEEAQIELKSYHGAGSTAGAMLKSWGIREVVRVPKLDGADELLSLPFFGGRFENSVIGKVYGLPENNGDLYGKDVSSAYPYGIHALPCLGCGTWEHTTKRRDLDGATTAIVRYSLPWVEECKRMSWGPFPFRLEEGTIAFPASSGGGWLWSVEYLAGERLWPNVKFHEAWVYRTDCGHQHFDAIARVYLERLLLGKDAKGLVLKTGMAAAYGKMAQSIGRPPFRSMAWAGMTTAGTRAQFLELIGLHRDRSNLLMIATDGGYSRENIAAPKPLPTAVARHFKEIEAHSGREARERAEKLFADKPLGGWETKVVKGGMFAARPGVYWELEAATGEPEPDDDKVKRVRARGIGRAEMARQAPHMIAAYERGEEGFRFENIRLFHNAKLSVRKTPSGEYVRAPRYGNWSDDNALELSFDPRPKRLPARPDGTLPLHNFPADLFSAAYTKGQAEDEDDLAHLLDEDDLYLEY